MNPVRILTVCSYNRTRSVMMEALLERDLIERLGGGSVEVRSAGSRTEGMPPIRDAITAMARRGLDVSGHRSQLIDVELLSWADLILTAERDHVVQVATIDPAAWSRAFTLPEFVEAAPLVDRGQEALRSWVEQLSADRSVSAYLAAPIGEIADPTGRTSRSFEAAVDDIETRCALAAAEIAGR